MPSTRTDMRNRASTVSQLMVVAAIALPACAFVTGCSSTSAPAASKGAAPTSPAPADDTSDAGLAARVKAVLAADPELRTLPISVSTYRGAVQLAGYVNSDLQIQKAIGLASGVRGVQSISNELHLR
jgi:hyperosmotically inducible periplasmic protein